MAQTTTDPVIDRIEIVDQPEETAMQEKRSPRRVIALALLVGILVAFVFGRRRKH